MSDDYISAPGLTTTHRYVCGFMFSEDRELVLLIKKKRPEWQRGKLNGVGGAIEGAETANAAMVREFAEETGVLTEQKDWRFFASLRIGHIPPVMICFFSACKKCTPTALTDERPVWAQVSAIRHQITAPHLRYLIPMALDKNLSFAAIEE